MLLVVDVGNTNTVFGVFAPDREDAVASIRASTRRDRMPDEWYAILVPALDAVKVRAGDLTGMIISSVVPPVTRWLREMGKDRLGVDPLVVNSGLTFGIGIDYPTPEEIGADRLVNSAAAYRKYGAPLISIDFGTAINFDVVNHLGNYVGGALAPGLIVAFEAMTGRAARLFNVDLIVPEHAIGKSTTEALQSGMMLGYLALMEGMITRLSAELEGDPTVIVTGGYSEVFEHVSPMIHHFEPDLTIAGLRYVYDLNHP